MDGGPGHLQPNAQPRQQRVQAANYRTERNASGGMGLARAGLAWQLQCDHSVHRLGTTDGLVTGTSRGTARTDAGNPLARRSPMKTRNHCQQD